MRMLEELVIGEHTNQFTGVFSDIRRVPLRHFDPTIFAFGATLARDSRLAAAMEVGGAGWTEAAARAACVGEGFERFRCSPTPSDALIKSSFSAWEVDEPAVDPARWILFANAQYESSDFPFRAFSPDLVCNWACCRNLSSGKPIWVPVDFLFLRVPESLNARICPQYSTGLSTAPTIQLAVLRGLQECIERDAITGAWWRHYRLIELPTETVLQKINERTPRIQFERPNLRYRFYKVETPFSTNVSIATLQGEDMEGPLFSIGSACREDLVSSLDKSLLEAIQGRLYVRVLRERLTKSSLVNKPPQNFAEHALFYSLNYNDLDRTVLTCPETSDLHFDNPIEAETLPILADRLGASKPILWRLVGHPWVKDMGKEAIVVRVVVPGLQPLHGQHTLPHLGGAVWGTRNLQDYGLIPPHPFP